MNLKLVHKIIILFAVLTPIAIIGMQFATYIMWKASIFQVIEKTLPADMLAQYELSSTIINSVITDGIIKLIIFQAIFTLFIACTFIISFRTIFLAPLFKIIKATRTVASGDLTQTISIESKDEMGKLSEDFNYMTLKLRESHEALDKKVEERTKELHEKIEELKQMNDLMVGRELKMKQLKEELDRLNKQLNGQQTSTIN